MFALAWGLSAAAVAVGGGLLSTYYVINPLVGTRWVLPAFVAVAIGGFGSIWGAFFGGVIIGVIQVVGGFLTLPNYKTLFVYGIFLLVVLFRPHGLMGRK
jgi:branched-chain amino acid transport system permease protein